MAPVDVIAFALLGLGLTAPLLTLGYSAQGFRLAAEAGSRVAALLATPELPGPRPGAAAIRAGGAVALDDVAFSYDGRVAVLRAITAQLEPGTVTALVGPSGAGKSTLAALIPRFWDVSGGAVRLGGADVRDLRADDLYAQVASSFRTRACCAPACATTSASGVPTRHTQTSRPRRGPPRSTIGSPRYSAATTR